MKAQLDQNQQDQNKEEKEKGKKGSNWRLAQLIALLVILSIPIVFLKKGCDSGESPPMAYTPTYAPAPVTPTVLHLTIPVGGEVSFYGPNGYTANYKADIPIKITFPDGTEMIKYPHQPLGYQGQSGYRTIRIPQKIKVPVQVTVTLKISGN